MKLGVVTTSYPRHAGDPAGRFVADQVAALRGLGHDVDIVAAGPIASDLAAATSADLAAVTSADPAAGPDLATYRLASSLFSHHGAPDRLEQSPLRSLLAAAAITARLVATVADLSRARGWQAIFAHWLAPSALAALAAPADIPIVAIAHGGDVFTLRRLQLLRPLLAALRRRRARLVFVSHQLHHLAGAPDDAIVQPIGLPLAHFAALERAPAEPPYLLILARLVPVKGVDVALRAPLSLPLVIAGDGPELPRLRALAPPSTRFLGAVAPDARDDLLRRAAAVVIPSRRLPNNRTEGTPLVALEALATGVPVIASAVGGLAELPHLTLVPPDDPAALAAATLRTLADPPPPAALRASVTPYDSATTTARLLTLLRA